MLTTSFYNINFKELIDIYDNADMSSLHRLLLKYIPEKSRVFDIGFGSARDLQFLFDNNYDIWGIDPSYGFVKNAKIRFPTKQDQFFKASVPYDKEVLGLNIKFEAVIIIAMWMHIQHREYENVVESIVSVLKDSSTVIISYSEGYRAKDERYFENVDLGYITQLFQNKKFTLIKTIKNEDSLKRDNLTWITVVYKHD